MLNFVDSLLAHLSTNFTDYHTAYTFLCKQVSGLVERGIAPFVLRPDRSAGAGGGLAAIQLV